MGTLEREGFRRGCHRGIREKARRRPQAFATVCDHRPQRPLAAFSGGEGDISGCGLRSGHRHADLQHRRKQISTDCARRFRRAVARDADRSDPSGLRPGGLVTMPTATYKELLIETVPQVIETEAQYRQIARRFGDLVGKGRDRSAEETKLLRLLALLVEDYDRRHALPPDNSNPAARLHSLLDHSGKAAADLRPVFPECSKRNWSLSAGVLLS